MEPRTTISLARRSPEQDAIQAMIDEATRQFAARGGKVECVGFRMKDATAKSYGRTGFNEVEEDPQDLSGPVESAKREATPPKVTPLRAKPRVRVMAGVVSLPQPSVTEAADSALADSLAVRAYYGDSLAAAARRLGESVTRCGDVARRYDVRFSGGR